MSSGKINESNDSGSLNKKILKELRLTSQEHMLFNCMDQFYNNKENTDNAVKLINFLDGEISIRLIDFFVTNYASKNRISYKIQLTRIYVSAPLKDTLAPRVTSFGINCFSRSNLCDKCI